MPTAASRALASLACVVAAAAPSGTLARDRSAAYDHLEVHSGRFGALDVPDYSAVLALLLLEEGVTPRTPRVLQLLVRPSFQGEYAVYVEPIPEPGEQWGLVRPIGFRLVHARMKRPLFAALEHRTLRDWQADSERDVRRKLLTALGPEVERQVAAISPATVAGLDTLWRAAILDARQPRPDRPLVLDGTTRCFGFWGYGAGYVVARAAPGTAPAGTPVGELLEVGRALIELAGAPPERREALEREILRMVDRAALRF